MGGAQLGALGPPTGLDTWYTELRAGKREVRWGWEVLSQTDRQIDRAETAPKLSHGFNFSHLNLRQRLSNWGPCPDSHTLPPGSGPLSLSPTPHLRLKFMDGSQPHPDTVGSSLPVFILERTRLSPLTHPVSRLMGRPTQVTALCMLMGTPRAVFVCMGTRVSVYQGVRAGGQEAQLSFWGLCVP